MLKKTVMVIALSAPAFGYGAVYQCKVDGQTIFSDQPCGADAKEIEVKAPGLQGGSSMQSDAGNRFVEVRQLERDIQRLEREKEKLRSAMDRALARWQQQKRRANNNLAGATWEQSLAQEAEVLRERYQSEIDDVDRQLDRKRQERERVLSDG